MVKMHVGNVALTELEKCLVRAQRESCTPGRKMRMALVCLHRLASVLAALANRELST